MPELLASTPFVHTEALVSLFKKPDPFKRTPSHSQHILSVKAFISPFKVYESREQLLPLLWVLFNYNFLQVVEEIWCTHLFPFLTPSNLHKVRSEIPPYQEELVCLMCRLVLLVQRFELSWPPSVSPSPTCSWTASWPSPAHAAAPAGSLPL